MGLAIADTPHVIKLSGLIFWQKKNDQYSVIFALLHLFVDF